MIICTWFVLGQLNFINNKYLGYNKQDLIAVDIPNSSEASLAKLKERFTGSSMVTTISFTEEIPGASSENFGTFLYQHPSGDWEEILSKHFSADEDFVDCLELPLLEGEGFGMFESQAEVLVNESFVKATGNQDIVGTQIRLPFRNIYGAKQVTIAGIVKDFHFRSLHEEIQPLIIMYSHINRKALLRVSSDGAADFATLKSGWNEVFPDQPFDYEYVEDRLTNLYRSDIMAGRIFSLFAIITTVLACLGLFALSYYTSELRKKEIGIRKINGAGLREILYLVNREYLSLVSLGSLISWPLAYIIIEKWLDGFAYKIEIDMAIFVIALLTALLITLATVSINSLKVANTNIIEVINRG